MLEQAILWRRIDSPGHDACGLWSAAEGWRLAGTATFLAEGQPCLLQYQVECDSAWRTCAATVEGWMGSAEVSLAIAADAGERWSLNGVEYPELAGLVDIDLGFTPATNLVQLRRLSLQVGQGAEAPTAYLAFPELTLRKLEHRYQRVAADAYDYEAPCFGYAARLQVSECGFVTHYPGLWELEAPG
ncbi:MAG: putative glycolipid-binding domain-containing protein [Actinomycetota bacterium]